MISGIGAGEGHDAIPLILEALRLGRACDSGLGSGSASALVLGSLGLACDSGQTEDPGERFRVGVELMRATSARLLTEDHTWSQRMLVQPIVPPPCLPLAPSLRLYP